MRAASVRERWIVCYGKRQSEPSLRLFCAPYAGGGASVFRAWGAGVPASVEVCAIQPPGRETRLREQPYTRLAGLAEELAQALHPLLDRPFAFYGHSVGALVVFEAARWLRSHCGVQPVHLWAAACPSPQIPETDVPIHTLPESEFRERLRRFNGTPREVLEHEELMELVGPILRADFALRETYEYVPDAPLDCPITALGGREDGEVDEAVLRPWQQQTRANFRLRVLAGDHFFLHSAQALVLQTLNEELRTYLPQESGETTAPGGGRC